LNKLPIRISIDQGIIQGIGIPVKPKTPSTSQLFKKPTGFL